jgi:hypothetical protein
MPTYQERSAGIFRCTYLGSEERDMTNPETQQEEPRWIWKFQEKADPTSAGQIDKITGTSLKSPNSNAYKIASGLMGRKLQPGDDTDDVVYGPNQAGNLTITSVVRAGGAQGGAAAGIAAPGPSEAVTDPTALPVGDVPF